MAVLVTSLTLDTLNGLRKWAIWSWPVWDDYRKNIQPQFPPTHPPLLLCPHQPHVPQSTATLLQGECPDASRLSSQDVEQYLVRYFQHSCTPQQLTRHFSKEFQHT